MADGQTGALFLLRANLVVMALSWGCFDMKMGGLMRLGASKSASLRRGGAFLRLVGLFSDRIKCDLEEHYLNDAEDGGKFGHGFLFSEVLLMNVSCKF